MRKKRVQVQNCARFDLGRQKYQLKKKAKNKYGGKLWDAREQIEKEGEMRRTFYLCHVLFEYNALLCNHLKCNNDFYYDVFGRKSSS